VRILLKIDNGKIRLDGSGTRENRSQISTKILSNIEIFHYQYISIHPKFFRVAVDAPSLPKAIQTLHQTESTSFVVEFLDAISSPYSSR